MAYWHQNDPSVSFVYFHETREGAMKWANSPLCGYALYRVDSEDVPGLEPHPQTPKIWRTPEPVPFEDLVLIETRGPDTTLPGLPEMVRARAADYPGVVTL
jgi:hypothetical protein